MKVVAINGSPRKDGNTTFLINIVFEELRKEDIETEMIQIGGQPVRGCLACYQCFDKKDCKCANDKDFVNKCIEKMIEADGIILASPTYFANVSTEMKALIDRAGMVAKANNALFSRKVGASVVAVRRAGSVNVFDALNKFFFISEMVVPGSSYWNLGIGRNPGDVKDDTEGINTMKVLGQNMAWLLKKIA